MVLVEMEISVMEFLGIVLLDVAVWLGLMTLLVIVVLVELVLGYGTVGCCI
jgi:hypothetical protein